MTPTTSTVESLDHLDPWGFGRAETADRSAVIEHFEPLDEPVDADEPTLAGLHGLAAPLPCPAARPALAPLPAPGGDRSGRLPFPRQMAGVLALFAAVIVVQAFYIGFSLAGEASARPGRGEVIVSSHPTGAEVRVDGQRRGTTPLVLPLAAGRHRLDVLGAAGVPARIEADIVAGKRLTRHVVLAAAVAPTAAVGTLRVDTGVTPAQVVLDGARAGATPFTRADLVVGEHAVRVEFGSGVSVERAVTVRARETLSLVVEPPPAPRPAPAAPAAPAAGWVRVDASFDVQVFRAGKLVGSSGTARIALPAGAHVLELVNAALGYRASVTTTVVAGRLAPLTVDTPRVPVAINAQPWAEVLVDGRVYGETPLANLMIPIGVHDVVLRHPELGARTMAVTVRATGANRVSADLRR